MIYLLEDDESIRNFVLYTLNNTGLEAEGFEKPSDFWAALNKEFTGASSVGYNAAGAGRP